MAFPHLSDLQRKCKDKGLRVVGVCLEDDVAQARYASWRLSLSTIHPHAVALP
jgi:hypothetical protein